MLECNDPDKRQRQLTCSKTKTSVNRLKLRALNGELKVWRGITPGGHNIYRFLDRKDSCMETSNVKKLRGGDYIMSEKKIGRKLTKKAEKLFVLHSTVSFSAIFLNGSLAWQDYGNRRNSRFARISGFLVILVNGATHVRQPATHVQRLPCIVDYWQSVFLSTRSEDS